jgi:hypothetical protein
VIRPAIITGIKSGFGLNPCNRSIRLHTAASH